MIARVVKKIQRPFFWFLLQTTQDNSWSRYPCKVPLHIYGAGSRRPFSWYLEGQIDTGAMDMEGMKMWLNACQYVSDDQLFNERDVWQHPLTFENLRKGDCEDFSLWTWRKLVEAGIETEFVAGWSVQPGGEYRGHTWVTFRKGVSTYVFDAVSCDTEHMIQPLEAVKDWYVPQVSVDHQLDQFVYGGYYDRLRSGWLDASKPAGS